jgi:succinate-acetate transporter protein
MSFATILIPGSGVISSYGDNVSELESALGIYLVTWFIVTFLFLYVFAHFLIFRGLTNIPLSVVSLRKSIAFIALLGFLTLTFMLLAAQKFSGKDR